MQIQFLGAARTVTGSSFLLKTRKANILIDCGMFQGIGFENRNYESFEFDPRSIDYAILTHSHLDHCGMLPKLYKYGFRGNVFMTPPTREIVEHMLLDSAKVQVLKFREWKRKEKYQSWSLKKSRNDKSSLHKPIYNTTDVLGLFKHFKTIKFGSKFDTNKGLSFSFLRVGHALGAASVILTVTDDDKEEEKILFSGDIGNYASKLDSRFDYSKSADYVVMESLYGGKEHEDRDLDEQRLIKVINRTLSRGGNVIIPSFTYQRSQEVLYTLKTLIESKRIPDNMNVYLDSPLAIKVTDVYKKYYNYLNPEIVKKERSGESLFSHKNFIFLKDSRVSKKIRGKRGSIIIAGHGMCAGGRVIYHLLDNLRDKRCSVVFVGFQAEGTLGREIVDGANEVIIEGTKVKVKAEIVRLFAFSAHAGNSGLLRWVTSVDKKRIKKVFLVHAEEQMSLVFQDILKKRGYSVMVPEWKKVYNL